MEYIGADNEVREDDIGDMPQVEANEGESHHSRGDSLVEYVGIIKGELRKGILASFPDKMLMSITRRSHQAPSFIWLNLSNSIF